MKSTQRIKRLLTGLTVGVGALLANTTVHAENWIPIGSGEQLFFIPQIHFVAAKTAPGQYQFSWNEQSGATS